MQLPEFPWLSEGGFFEGAVAYDGALANNATKWVKVSSHDERAF
jgi:hypothetical protein